MKPAVFVADQQTFDCEPELGGRTNVSWSVAQLQTTHCPSSDRCCHVPVWSPGGGWSAEISENPAVEFHNHVVSAPKELRSDLVVHPVGRRLCSEERKEERTAGHVVDKTFLNWKGIVLLECEHSVVESQMENQKPQYTVFHIVQRDVADLFLTCAGWTCRQHHNDLREGRRGSEDWRRPPLGLWLQLETGAGAAQSWSGLRIKHMCLVQSWSNHCLPVPCWSQNSLPWKHC